jgi:hypothetical protein
MFAVGFHLNGRSAVRHHQKKRLANTPHLSTMGFMETLNDFSAAEAHFDAMKQFLQRPEAHRLDLSGLEHHLAPEGRELLRQLLLAHITARGGGDIGASVVGADGVRRSHRRPRPRTILTLFGPLTIHRLAYGMPQVASLFPLDAMLNLPPNKVSYTVQHHLIHEVITRSFHEALDALQRWTGVTFTIALAQRIIRDAAQDFDLFYAQRYARESGEAQPLPLLVLTVDGTGVLVRTEDLRPATRKNRTTHATLSRGNPLAQPHREYTRRMATVASAYEIARFLRTPEDFADRFFTPPPHPPLHRPVPTAKRLWASLTLPSKTVIQALFEDACRRDPNHTKEWVVLVDGDLHQLTRVQACAKQVGVPVTIVCDIVHVLGYLWKAGAVLQRKEVVAPWVHDALLRVLLGHSAVVASTMRAAATRRKLSATARKSVDVCARYLHNHAPYLAYHRYLKAGYPVATGVIEGGCRYLVKDRLTLTGARWSLNGAEAVLKLRAVKVSGDLASYWTFYEQQQYRRIHECLYQTPSVLTQGGSSNSAVAQN